MKNLIFVILLAEHPFLVHTQTHDYFKAYIDSLKKYNISYTLTNVPKAITRLPFIRDSIMKQQKLLEKNQSKKTQYLIEYVKYIQKVTDTTILRFIKEDNYVDFYPCYLAPYAEYCKNNKINGYCNEAPDHLLTLFKKYKIQDSLISDEWQNINPSALKPLSNLLYYYNYDLKKSIYLKNPNGRCVSYKHNCLVVDVLKKDESAGILFILTFHFPGKYYSLFMYDYQKGYLIPDIQLLYKIDLNKLNMHSSKTYFAYWANQLLAYTKSAQIKPLASLYKLFVLYDKMKIKSVYHVSYNLKKEK